MEAIERAAHVSVGRACAFCGLAVICFMVGFAYDLKLAARIGGSFALIVSIVLLIKAWLALRTNYKHTETWLILPEQDRPTPAQAQAMISAVLRQVFMHYAWYSALTALLLLSASIVLGIVRG